MGASRVLACVAYFRVLLVEFSVLVLATNLDLIREGLELGADVESMLVLTTRTIVHVATGLVA